MAHTVKFPGSKPDSKHIITQKPLRLRWGDWRVLHAVLVHVQPAALYENLRDEQISHGIDPGGQMPSHFALDDGMQETSWAILRHRDDAYTQIEILYLASLMEVMIKTSSPILRTDLIRRVYQEIDQLSQKLALRWRGRARYFMLPLNEDVHNPNYLAEAVTNIDNLQDFFTALHSLAESRHSLLARNYVIYYPQSRHDL